MAIPVLFVALVAHRLPEPRTAPRRVTRLFLTVVLIALALSQIVEGIGAFASSARSIEGLLESMHRMGEAGTLFSIFALPLSVLFLTLVYAMAAIHTLVRRFHARGR